MPEAPPNIRSAKNLEEIRQRKELSPLQVIRAEFGSNEDAQLVIDYLSAELARHQAGGRVRIADQSESVLPKSVIASVTYNLIDTFWDGEDPVRAGLLCLLLALLEINRPVDIDKRKQTARDEALWIKAFNSDISDADVAKAVGVNRATVGRWFDDEEFQERINNLQRAIRENS